MRKKLFQIALTGIMVAALATSVNAQWSRNSGTQVTYLTNGGDKVGIGTTAPSYKLDIKESANCNFRVQSISTGSANLILARSSDTKNCLVNYKTGTTDKWFTGCKGDNDFSIQDATGTPVFTLSQSSNNIGIGTTTPVYRLHVKSASTSIIAVDGGTATSESWFYYLQNGTFRAAVGYRNSNGSVTIYNGGDRLVVNNSGNTGIGTTAPDVRLHVVGGTDAGPSGGGYIQAGATTGANVVIDNNEIMARSNGAVSTLFLNHNGGDLIINGTRSTGNVGIGTSSPTTNLQLVHDQFVGSSAAGGLKLTNTSNSATWTEYVSQSSSGLALYFNDALRGTFDDASGSYSSVSDARLKKNVEPLAGIMDKVMQVKPCQYDFKSNPEAGKKYFGFIAQELETVFPEVVMICKNDSKDGGDDIHTVKYTELIPVLFKAVQEQQQTIEKQNEKIASLESMINSCCENSSSVGAKSAGNVSLSENKLFQNQPNPFNQSTVLRYSLNENAGNAQIVIRDLNGNLVKSISVKAAGRGQVTINANELAQGTYTYSLEVNSESVDTKLMVVTK